MLDIFIIQYGSTERSCFWFFYPKVNNKIEISQEKKPTCIFFLFPLQVPPELLEKSIFLLEKHSAKGRLEFHHLCIGSEILVKSRMFNALILSLFWITTQLRSQKSAEK